MLDADIGVEQGFVHSDAGFRVNSGAIRAKLRVRKDFDRGHIVSNHLSTLSMRRPVRASRTARSIRRQRKIGTPRC